MATYLKSCCRLQNAAASANVRSAYKGKPRSYESFSEVIIDEAQDLDSVYYDSISSFSVSYGADDAQILYPEHSSSQQELRSRYSGNVSYTLDKNFRSTQRIMLFAKDCFPNAYIPMSLINALSNNVGEKPVFMLTRGTSFGENSNSQQDQAIKQIISSFRSDTHNIAILVPFKSDVRAFRNVLASLGVQNFTHYYEDSIDFPDGCERISNVHVCTFKSAKGLEFDTVIIPNFEKMSNLCGRYNTDWNDYYVAVTRARSNLYLISGRDMSNLHSVVDFTRL